MEGKWRPGEKLEALRLADDFGVSMTPVRDCLNRLVGEGLVEMKPGDGYRVPRISEKILRDMLDLNAMLLEFALAQPSNAGPMPKSEYLVTDYAGRISIVFEVIASRSANVVLAELLHSLGDRLHAIRQWEPHLFSDWAQELTKIERQLTGDPKALNDSLRQYHDRRRDKIAELVQLSL